MSGFFPIRQSLLPRQQRWVSLLFQGVCTHDDLAGEMGITKETSRSYQKRISERLGLEWGRQKIPHIMAKTAREVVHWVVLLAISMGSITGTGSDFRRPPTTQRTITRLTRANRKESNTAYLPRAA